MLYDYPQLFYAYTQLYVIYHYCFYASPLNFLSREICILYIVGTHFYVLLEHFWHTLLEQLSIYF
jgi:hypothetical protein